MQNTVTEMKGADGIRWNKRARLSGSKYFSCHLQRKRCVSSAQAGKQLFIIMPRTVLNVPYTLLCAMEVCESLCTVLKIIALFTAGDAGSSNLAANCRTGALSSYVVPVIARTCLLWTTSTRNTCSVIWVLEWQRKSNTWHQETFESLVAIKY